MRFSSPKIRLLLATTALLGLCGVDCGFGGQTGGELTPPDKGGLPHAPISGGDTAGIPVENLGCAATRTEVALDELTEGGFSANDVLPWLTQFQTTRLVWNIDSAGVSFSPAPEADTIGISVAYLGSPAQWAEATALEGCDPSHLELPTQVMITTASGALLELTPATLNVFSPELATLRLVLPPSELQGTFRIALAPNQRFGNLSLSSNLTPQGNSGTLSGWVETASVSTSGIGTISAYVTLLAGWPELPAQPAP